MSDEPIGLRRENLPHVRAALKEARSLARKLGREPFYLLPLAAPLAVLDPAGAMRAVREIPVDLFRAQALSRVVDAVADNDPDLAFAASREMTDNRSRVQALKRLLNALQPGSALIAPVADDVEAVGAGIEDRNLRERAMGGAVRALARLDAERAIQLARRARGVGVRRWLLWVIAEQVAERNFPQGLAFADGINDPTDADATERADRLRWRVAHNLARTAPARARRVARGITDSGVRDGLLFRVMLDDAACSAERLRASSGRLFACARRQDTPARRAQALRWLAGAWDDLQLVPPPELRSELMAMVRNLDYRDRERESIAELVARWDPSAALGMVEGLKRRADYDHALTVEEKAIPKLAETDPHRAVVLARKVRCRSCRDDLLQAIGAACAKVNAGEALDMIQGVKARATRMKLLRGWAEQVAKACPTWVLTVAREQERDDVRWEMMRGIADGLAVANVRRAVRVARMIPDDETRFWALLDILERTLLPREG